VFIIFCRTNAANCQYPRHGNSIVKLGKRIFIAGGQTDKVEEYHEDIDKWTTADFKISQSKYHFDALAIPASLFSHLPGGCVGVK
jgi:hypothetical protein